MTVNIFDVFSKVTEQTAKNPIPTISTKRAEELKTENANRLRQAVQNNNSLHIQTDYDTPKNNSSVHTFPNSRTGEEKDTEIAERKAAANPYSQARHPSPPQPLPECANDEAKPEQKVDLSRIFYSR
ncbi:MAG: hypothetical protein KKG59_02055 [Nanoarchaeota archaeon]|nr:hypothetical protein [Nanoarchaeota archaeon]